MFPDPAAILLWWRLLQNTGNFVDFGLDHPNGTPKRHYNQSLRGKFPTQRNRELIMPYQRIKSPQQGSFEVFRQISEGWLWLAFLALTGGKIDQGVPS